MITDTAIFKGGHGSSGDSQIIEYDSDEGIKPVHRSAEQQDNWKVIIAHRDGHEKLSRGLLCN